MKMNLLLTKDNYVLRFEVFLPNNRMLGPQLRMMVGCNSMNHVVVVEIWNCSGLDLDWLTLLNRPHSEMYAKFDLVVLAVIVVSLNVIWMVVVIGILLVSFWKSIADYHRLKQILL